MGSLPPYSAIGFVGLGLLGGSIARLIREHHPSLPLYAVSRRQSTIDYACEHGIIDGGGTTVEALPQSCALVFICTPIRHLSEDIKSVSEWIKSTCVITDIGSVKEQVIRTVKHLRPEHLYIPGHPMAGNEKTGITHAESTLVKEANYFLVPTPHPAYDTFKTFLRELQFTVIEMDARTHDKLAATASHIPYLMAALTLSPALGLSKAEQQLLKSVIASGFRDTTRVASSDPVWGADVAEFNQANILDGLQEIQDKLKLLESLIREEKFDVLVDELTTLRMLREGLYQ